MIAARAFLWATEGRVPWQFFESKFAMHSRKRIILVRMIPFAERFDHLQARQLFGVNKLCLEWIEGQPMPANLVADIVKAVRDPSTAPPLR